MADKFNSIGMQNKIDNIFKIATVLSFFLIGLGNFKVKGESFDFICIYFIITASIFICFLYITYRVYKPLPNIILKLIITDKIYININNLSLHAITIVAMKFEDINKQIIYLNEVKPIIIYNGNIGRLEFDTKEKKTALETITLFGEWNNDPKSLARIVYRLSFWEKRKLSKILNKNKI